MKHPTRTPPPAGAVNPARANSARMHGPAPEAGIAQMPEQFVRITPRAIGQAGPDEVPADLPHESGCVPGRPGRHCFGRDRTLDFGPATR